MVDVKQRLSSVDMLRGIALVGMVIFHVYYILSFLEVTDVTTDEGLLLVLARSVQFLFLGIVGVSMVLSYQAKVEGFVKRQVKRALLVLLMAGIVSVVTYFAIGDLYVKFGILHFIGVSILLLAPMIQRKWFLAIVAVGSIFFGEIFEKMWSEWFALYLFGFRVEEGGAIDYFPIFPWISVVAIGALIAWYGRRGFEVISGLRIGWLEWIGRHTLLIYMLHVPVILFVFFIFGINLK